MYFQFICYFLLLIMRQQYYSMLSPPNDCYFASMNYKYSIILNCENKLLKYPILYINAYAYAYPVPPYSIFFFILLSFDSIIFTAIIVIFFIVYPTIYILYYSTIQLTLLIVSKYLLIIENMFYIQFSEYWNFCYSFCSGYCCV